MGSDKYYAIEYLFEGNWLTCEWASDSAFPGWSGAERLKDYQRRSTGTAYRVRYFYM